MIPLPTSAFSGMPMSAQTLRRRKHNSVHLARMTPGQDLDNDLHLMHIQQGVDRWKIPIEAYVRDAATRRGDHAHGQSQKGSEEFGFPQSTGKIGQK